MKPKKMPKSVSKVFDHFPADHATCPVCKTNKDKPCVLLPIDDTEEGNICQGQPTHAECLQSGFRYNQTLGVIYMMTKESDEDETTPAL